MKRIVIGAMAFVVAMGVLAEDGSQKMAHQGEVELGEKLDWTSIRQIRIKIVDPGGISSSDSNPVITVRKEGDKGTTSQLGNVRGKPAIKTGSSITFDENAAKEASPSNPKLSDPFPTGVTVRAGAGKPDYTGLMKSQIDTQTGSVESIKIPTDPEKVINNPRKADGSAITQADLFKLGQGQVPNITLRDGTVLNGPSGGPVSG